jgi:hypothetical protein
MQFAGGVVDPYGQWEASTPCFHILVHSYVHYFFCVEAQFLLTLSLKLAVTHIEFVRPRHAMYCRSKTGLLERRRVWGGLGFQLLLLHILVLTTFRIAQWAC